KLPRWPERWAPACSGNDAHLEDQLRADLDPAWCVTCCNLTKRAIGEALVYAAAAGSVTAARTEALVVEGIEELASQLERYPFGDPGVFDSCKIPVIQAGAKQAAGAFAAPMVDSGSERSGRKPLVDRLGHMHR